MASRPAIPSVRPVALSGARISLREVTIDDAADAFAWGSDDEWFAYLAHDPVETIEQEQAFLESLVADSYAEPRRQYHLGVVAHGSSTLIGLVRLGVSSFQHYSADVGYGVRRDLWGQGLTTEAVDLLVDFGFSVLGLHRIWAHHHPDNVASERVLQKLGMTKEGRLRHNMLAHGDWRDSNLYAVLEQDWRGQHP